MHEKFSTWYNQILVKIKTDNKFIGSNSALSFENFIKELLNKLWHLKLKNLNLEKHNYPALDLADDNNKIAVQIKTSDESVNAMFKKTLQKLPQRYLDYDIFVVSLINKNNRLEIFDTESKCKSISFLDFNDILRKIFTLNSFELNEIEKVFFSYYSFLLHERKVSRLSKIAHEFLNKLKDDVIEKQFLDETLVEISKKIVFNNLDFAIEKLIDGAIGYSQILDETYNEFLLETRYNVMIIIKKLSRIYEIILHRYYDQEKEINYSNIFFEIIEIVFEELQNNLEKEYDTDELITAAEIIVVNAFIKCFVLEKPNN